MTPRMPPLVPGRDCADGRQMPDRLVMLSGGLPMDGKRGKGRGGNCYFGAGARVWAEIVTRGKRDSVMR